MSRPVPPRLLPRLRVLQGDAIALGPGKADLLAAIATEGSLAAAARRLEMSYMRAWTLVRAMNDAFAQPLVELERGGKGHGGARLTVLGLRVLELYRAMERAAVAGAEPAWQELQGLLSGAE
jgi:molybdate transport system regulatory protein